MKKSWIFSSMLAVFCLPETRRRQTRRKWISREAIILAMTSPEMG